MKQHPFLDVRRLRYFLAIATEKSISAAARDLNVAQPALSHHIAALERDLAAPLLIRHQSGVTLTPLGELLMQHARSIVGAIEKAEVELLETVAGGKSVKTIRLAIIPSLASALTPALIRGFAHAFPDVDLHLIDARTAFGDELIESGRADIAIQLVRPQDVTDEPLAWEDMFWVRRFDSGDFAVGPIAFSTLANARLILPSKGNPLRLYLQTVAEQEGIVLDVSREMDGPDPRKQAVLAGMGTTVFGAHSVTPESLGTHLIAHQIVEPKLSRPIVMVSRKGLDADLRATIHVALSEILQALPTVK